MGKGKPTLTQKQQNASYESNLPPKSLYDPSVPGQKAQGSDPYVPNQFTDLAEATVRSLFGPEFLRGLALAIDPLAQYFRDTYTIVPWNRSRKFYANGSPYLSMAGKTDIIATDAWYFSPNSSDDPGTASIVDVYPVPFYTPNPTLDPEYGMSMILDTANSTRGDKKFGTCYMEIITGSSPLSQDAIGWVNRVEYRSPSGRLTTLNITTYRVNYAGPPNYLGLPFKPSFDGDRPMLYYWMNNLVLEMIRDTTPDKPVFETLYNIVELKDLPRLVQGLISLKKGLEKCVALNFDLSRTDKFLADQYLNFQFGVKSLYQAAEGILKLPAKAAKKLNYLLRIAGKPRTSRSKRNFKDKSSWDAPWTSSRDLGLPFGEVLSARYTYTSETEIRLTLCQTIKFPEVVEPKFSDKNYRKLLGLQPTVKVIYDLIPFTWLVDWFTSLGDYVNIVDMIFQDPQIIHYGFMTGVTTETYTIEAYVTHTSAVQHFPDDETEYTVGQPVLVKSSISKKTYYREDLSAFDGVKLFGSSGSGLNPFQTSILGSLLTKLSK